MITISEQQRSDYHTDRPQDTANLRPVSCAVKRRLAAGLFSLALEPLQLLLLLPRNEQATCWMYHVRDSAAHGLGAASVSTVGQWSVVAPLDGNSRPPEPSGPPACRAPWFECGDVGSKDKCTIYLILISTLSPSLCTPHTNPRSPSPSRPTVARPQRRRLADLCALRCAWIQNPALALCL